MGDFVEIEKQGAIGILRMNHDATLNSIASHEDCRDLIHALEDLADDSSISVGIFTGNGRAFSAGGNLKAIQQRNGIGPLEQPDSTRSNYRRGVQRITRAFMDIEVPMIAAVNGHAVGLGCDLACLCDMRIAAESAKFSSSFIKVGIVPGDGGAWSLQQVVGYAKAAEMFFTGDRYTAHEAKAMGLVSEVVADDKLLDEALALAGRIAVNPVRALRLTKRLLREAQKQRMDDVLELSAAYQAIVHETEDHAEAVAALIEKRDPTFSGK
ncbi:MAG: crotonase/enoyl-CoA hydratase family protein [Gammaproteobacteria bacterium]|nr:crotonase/enoyl-CoA hydratase family protein [Gammaproteobacteria bacterium]